MSEIQQTLAERGATYGSFEDVATMSQNLQATMRNSKNWGSMPDEMREALQTISSKIARILNGDPNHVDSWHDIAGYATLVEKGLSGQITPDWDAAEKRMDIIGPNGNDGTHYRTLTLPEDVTIPESAHFVVVYENGQMVAHDLKPVLAQGCWHAAAGNQYIGLGDGSQAGLYERMPSDIWVRADD